MLPRSLIGMPKKLSFSFHCSRKICLSSANRYSEVQKFHRIGQHESSRSLDKDFIWLPLCSNLSSPSLRELYSKISIRKCPLLFEELPLSVLTRQFSTLTYSCSCCGVLKSKYKIQKVNFSTGSGLKTISESEQDLAADTNLNESSHKPRGKNGSPSPPKEKVPRTMDQVIYHMQSDIRNKKRIHKAEINNGVELAEKAGKVEDFGAFLLNCCSELVPDLTPETRMKLAQRLWAVIQSAKEYTVENFEAMLKAIAINEDKTLNPFDYLEEAERAKVEITPTMYFFALLTICQRGDTDGMLEILTSMKRENIPINEKFFNVLILGNGRIGDLEGAKEILDVLYSSGLAPSAETWTMLLRVFVESGSLEKVKETIIQIFTDQFSEDQLYELLKVAGRQSDGQILDYVIDWILSSGKMHYRSLKRLTVILMYQGHYENALKIILKFSKILKAERDEYLGAFFIKELHHIIQDPELYLKLVMSLQDEKRNPFALNKAAETCLKHKKIDLVFKIFEGMLVMNVPIRPHYFYVALMVATEKDDVFGIVKVMKQMKSLNVAPDWEMLVDWIVPTVFEKKQDMLETLRIIKDSCEISYASGLHTAGLVVALQQGRTQDALSLTKFVKSKVTHPDTVVQSLFKCISERSQESPNQVCNNIPDLSFVSQILKYVADNVPSDDNRDFAGGFILKLFGSERTKEAEMILGELRKLNVPLSNAVVEVIRGKLDQEEFDIDPTLGRFNGNGRRILNPSEMDSTGLECHKQELEAKDLNARGVCRKLFLKYCQQGDLEKALEMKKEFETEYGALSSGMKSALMGVYLKNGVLDSALEIFEQLSSVTVDSNSLESDVVTIDTYKIIDLATLMVKKSRLPDALKIIYTEFSNRTDPRPETFSRNIVRLLEAVSHANIASLQEGDQAGDENMVYNLTEFFIKTGLLKPTNPTLGPVIKDLIRRDKLEDAVERLEEFSKRFRAVPALQELTYKVLGNSVLLNRVVQCSSAVKGVRDAKRMLALAKADVGDTDGAAALFLELGNQLSFISIIRQVEYLSTKRDFDKILNLINSLYKTNRGYNCSGLYEIAIKACERLGDEENLKRICSSMQEHDLHIPKEAYKILHSKGIL